MPQPSFSLRRHLPYVLICGSELVDGLRRSRAVGPEGLLPGAQYLPSPLLVVSALSMALAIFLAVVAVARGRDPIRNAVAGGLATVLHVANLWFFVWGAQSFALLKPPGREWMVQPSEDARAPRAEAWDSRRAARQARSAAATERVGEQMEGLARSYTFAAGAYLFSLGAVLVVGPVALVVRRRRVAPA